LDSGNPIKFRGTGAEDDLVGARQATLLGQFAPSPYIPVRWTSSQFKRFEQAPMLDYLQRPVEIKLTDEQGHPLKTAAEADALKVGWEQALAT
jgi:hypothetical protein